MKYTSVPYPLIHCLKVEKFRSLSQSKGLLQEGIHYVRVNSRVIRYNAQLLQDWLANRYDSVAHQRAIEIYQASLLSNKKKIVH